MITGLSWPFRVVGGRLKTSVINVDLNDVTLAKELVIRNLLISVTDKWGNLGSGGNAMELVFNNFDTYSEEAVKSFLYVGVLKEVPFVEIKDISFVKMENTLKVTLNFTVFKDVSINSVSFDDAGEVSA